MMTPTEIAELAERLNKLSVQHCHVDERGAVSLVFFRPVDLDKPDSFYKGLAMQGMETQINKAMKDAAVAEEERNWGTPRETDIDLVTKPMRFDDAELQEQPAPLSPGIEVNDVSKE